MPKVVLNVKGMTCSACQNGLEKYLNKQQGVTSATVNLVLAQATVTYEDNLTVEDIERFISEAGFESAGLFNPKKEKNNIFPLIFYGFLVLIILYISMYHMLGLPKIDFLNEKVLFILTIPFLVYGRDIFKSGFKNLIHKMPNMDTLVSLGVITSFIYSLINLILIMKGNTSLVNSLYFDSCAIIIYFIKLGRSIDNNSKEKLKDALTDLVQITPTKALVKRNNKVEEVTIDEVVEGDILVCKPGSLIAVDGVVTKGSSHVDEAFITGEAIPNKKVVNSDVVAGSMNIDGYIEYKALRIGKNSTISQIVNLVVDATNTKAPVERLADKISSYFVPGIIIIALATLIGYLLCGFSLNTSLISFVTVLVVACPCSLGLATPLAIVVAISRSTKKGILIKKSEVLEKMNKIDTVIFDKTGSLTYGNLQIENIINLSSLSEEEFLLQIASLENLSTHPIANAFKKYVHDKNISLEEVSDFKNIEGVGLKGIINEKEVYVGSDKLFTKLKIKPDKLLESKLQDLEGATLVYLIIDKKVLGLVTISDVVRKEAKEVIEVLSKDKDIYMLTGDNEKNANTLGKKLGIKNIKANLYPSDKTLFIKELTNKGRNVMMVGDGINDAPALATAMIGVSFSSATDIAANSADIVLMNNDLSNIVQLFNIGKKTLRIIKQNLFWAFFYNICMIPIAIGLFRPLGISITPMIAGISMTVSSLTVVFNSLRLRR